MRQWNLKPGDPLALSLAADARLSQTNYLNDHIWELFIGTGDPPALALQTSFGLRARSYRIFPIFKDKDQQIIDPALFHRPVHIKRFFPNYLQLNFAPFADVDVLCEYWVPDSQTLTCRMTITNNNSNSVSFDLDWAALLVTTPGGERMAPIEMNASTVLAGHSEDLFPLLFLTGGPQSSAGPYPALGVTVALPARDHYHLTWVHVAKNDLTESFSTARKIAALNWDAHIANIEMHNTGILEIYTGDDDWDAAFAFSQKEAYKLLMSPGIHLQQASFVITRLPDQGYSLRGDGSDYNYLWNGQTPLDALCLFYQLIPGASHLAQGIVKNWLDIQSEDGFIDWKPGLAGQRSQILATPLLASLTWRVFQQTQDTDFLAYAFPKCLAFIKSWLKPQHDRDQDGFPEWTHPVQSGFDDNPLFTSHLAWYQGADITTFECPDLCAFIYLELACLNKIARQIKALADFQPLQEILEAVKSHAQSLWDTKRAIYHYRDRDSHLHPGAQSISSQNGDGDMIIHRSLAEPSRLLFTFTTGDEATRQPTLSIHGVGPTGAHIVEQIGREKISWNFGTGRVTTERVYSEVEQIIVQGLRTNDRINVTGINFVHFDQTQLLPFWAGLSDAGQAQLLVKHSIKNTKKYWKPYGLPAYLDNLPPNGMVNQPSVHLLWNYLICEGLVNNGYRSLAAALLDNLMKAIIHSLKTEHKFYRLYHPESGVGSGEPGSVDSLAPTGLFMQVLGLQVIDPYQVFVSGYNPFPWTVTVKYQGLTIIRQKRKTMLIFPNAQSVSVPNGKRVKVTC